MRKKNRKKIVIRDIAGDIILSGFVYGAYGVVRRDPWGDVWTNKWILVHVKTGMYGDVCFENLTDAEVYCKWKEDQDAQNMRT